MSSVTSQLIHTQYLRFFIIFFIISQRVHFTAAQIQAQSERGVAWRGRGQRQAGARCRMAEERGGCGGEHAGGVEASRSVPGLATPARTGGHASLEKTGPGSNMALFTSLRTQPQTRL